ncbi:hypothetical protein OIU78_014889 [Salix suchowensis]|nr:hypothetical protein OIU78_014889 [Salix suchowensis]
MKSLPATSSPHHPIKTKPRSKVVALESSDLSDRCERVQAALGLQGEWCLQCL